MIKDFFKIIDNEEKAYWLGFLYADGCVTKDKKQLIVELSDKDYNHLEKFRKCIKCSNTIRRYERKGIKYARLCVTCKEFVSCLVDKGCVPNKTFVLQFPQLIIENNLIQHFIRGYFDGDGCISVLKYETPKKRINYSLSFLGTNSMLLGINNYLPINLSIKKENNIYRSRTQSKKNIIKIFEYMYKNSSIYLSRKKEKFIKCL